MDKWLKEEDEILLKCFHEKKTYKEMSDLLIKRTERAVRARLNNLGYKLSDVIDYSKKYVECNCKTCGVLFKKTLTEFNKNKNHFCSRSCSATFNNLNIARNLKGIVGSLYIKKEDKFCKNCNKKLDYQKSFCCNDCQGEHKRKENFKKIENGNTTLYHKNYRNYLIDKYGEKCMKCNWSETHPITGKVPVQMNHKDGNSENNSLDNLELLCPNCHSLTPNYGSLNTGNGRTKRQEYRKKQKEEKGFYI
jgi:hypothetical protein